MPKGPSTTQYIGGIVADQLSKMAATIIGSKLFTVDKSNKSNKQKVDKAILLSTHSICFYGKRKKII